MARCSGFKPDGTPCERIVGASQSYCYSHDPDRAGERRRNAAAGGRASPNKEIKALKAELENLAGDVLDGEVDKGDAAVVNQIINTRARLLELERKIREQDKLLERIERLEGAYPHARGGHAWG